MNKNPPSKQIVFKLKRYLVKNRDSLSIADVELLEEAIEKIMELSTDHDSNDLTLLKLIQILLRLFVNTDILGNWFDTL